MARPRQPQVCFSPLCRKEIQPWEHGGAEVLLMARTYGLGKRRAAKSERLFLCPRCATRVASEKEPTENVPLDRAFFRILLDLVGAHPDVVNATFEQLSRRRDEVLYAPTLPEPQILPPAKRLNAAS